MLFFLLSLTTGFAAEPTFSWIHKNILDKQCIQCHGGAGPQTPLGPRKIYFETYEHVLNEVVPFHPEESVLYLSLVPGRTSTLMPLDGTDQPLPEEEVQAVYDWIARGAQND